MGLIHDWQVFYKSSYGIAYAKCIYKRQYESSIIIHITILARCGPGRLLLSYVLKLSSSSLHSIYVFQD